MTHDSVGVISAYYPREICRMAEGETIVVFVNNEGDRLERNPIKSGVGGMVRANQAKISTDAE